MSRKEEIEDGSSLPCGELKSSLGNLDVNVALCNLGLDLGLVLCNVVCKEGVS